VTDQLTINELDRMLLKRFDEQALNVRYTGTRLSPLQIQDQVVKAVAKELRVPNAGLRLTYLLLLRERDPDILKENPRK